MLLRLERRSIVDPATGCRIWQGTCNQFGYGAITYKPPGVKVKTMAVHRLAYRLLVGPIPDGMQLDHTCRVRPCWEPTHLEVVTCRQNLIRGKTITARKATQTVCVRGHEFTPENTYIKPNGCRECRTCITLRNRWRYQR